MTESSVVTKVFEKLTPAFVKKINVNIGYAKAISTDILSNKKPLYTKAIPQDNFKVFFYENQKTKDDAYSQLDSAPVKRYMDKIRGFDFLS
jgi:hypothetical protein